ncbi:MAG: DEAD/DEAH box helicase [Halarcobacter sp.]
MPFSKLNLLPFLLKSIEENGYKIPTAIQEKVIPFVLNQKDIMAQAQTGSGKTASFVLPMIQTLFKNKSKGKAKIKALVLTPTRELTLQVAQTFNMFIKNCEKELKVVSLIGGESIGEQLYNIQQGCDIVVATSGRLLDILSKKQIQLSTLEFFVLDEADKMLNQGFSQELDSILEQIPKKRQNLMFSATYPPKILDIASKISTNAIKVNIKSEELTVDKITQRVIEINKHNRSALLRYIIKEQNLKSVLVFMSTKRSAENISLKFRKYGFKALSFHGDLEQEERNLTLEDFKNGDINILFATDIAARGLDIDDISCIVNFDLPRSTSDYIHRIGRTGRAGKSGLAISFIDYEDFHHFNLIEKRSNLKLQREQIKGFELRGTPPKKQKGNAPIKGKRKSKKDKLREQEKKD